MRTMLSAAGIAACAVLLAGAAQGQGVPHWEYNTSPDKMGRGEIKTAAVESANTVDFLPHKGQRATLVLRVHPRHGRTAMLWVGPSEFACRVGGCKVTVRLDTNKARELDAVRPADDSASNALFIRDHDRLLSGIRDAKRLLIEADFYGHGTRVFEFNVAGLQW